MDKTAARLYCVFENDGYWFVIKLATGTQQLFWQMSWCMKRSVIFKQFISWNYQFCYIAVLLFCLTFDANMLLKIKILKINFALSLPIISYLYILGLFKFMLWLRTTKLNKMVQHIQCCQIGKTSKSREVIWQNLGDQKFSNLHLRKFEIILFFRYLYFSQ